MAEKLWERIVEGGGRWYICPTISHQRARRPRKRPTLWNPMQKLICYMHPHWYFLKLAFDFFFLFFSKKHNFFQKREQATTLHYVVILSFSALIESETLMCLIYKIFILVLRARLYKSSSSLLSLYLLPLTVEDLYARNSVSLTNFHAVIQIYIGFLCIYGVLVLKKCPSQ